MECLKSDLLNIENEKLRVRKTFDFDWRFFKGDIQSAENSPSCGDGGFLPAGIGWYRKHFQIPKE
ncbi:MAG TPA: hypothetical protein VIK78_02210 [Ruminiclostridium sp.]